MKRKKEFIIILASIVVIILSVSVAYFTTKITSKNRKVTVTSSELKMVFTSGTGQINSSSITPGWTSGENTFTVTNESKKEYTYNLIIKDYINTTVTTGFLVYKITSTDGGYNMTDFIDMPKSAAAANTTLAENIPISAKTTHTYKIEIKYLDSPTVSQDEDQGKKLSGTIFIDGVKEASSQNPILASKLLEDNPTISTRSDFSTPFTTNTASTLYKATENGTDVYYFAGQDTTSTPINNWVKFGKNSSNQDLYWRIIRTNSDGSIRLLYHGISTTAIDAYIGTSKFNTNVDSPKYVGYMYGDTDATLEEARTNTNDSTIKTAIDNWYASNMTSYTKYLSPTAVYCNDRELATGSKYVAANYIKNDTETLIAYLDAEDTKKTIIAAPTPGAIGFTFKSYERLDTNKTPTYDCTNNNDKFTVDASTGNGKLTYPIALMTADEIAYAGGVYDTNAPMWYYTNSSLESSTSTQWWWSLSPYDWHDLYAWSWLVRGSVNPGYLLNDDVHGVNGVRPVVSLKSCIKYRTGNGTSGTPYEIVETSSGC